MQITPLLKGFRNGLYYGGRLRLIHALVMTLLFKSIDKASIIQILQAARQHAWFLGRFVLFYKTLRLLLSKITKNTYLQCFLAGAGASLLLNREKTSIRYQIVLYLFSRIVAASCSILYQKFTGEGVNSGQYQEDSLLCFRILATLCWGLVMLLFYSHRDHLQTTLSGSMDFLYESSENKVVRWGQLIPFWIPESWSDWLGGPSQ